MSIKPSSFASGKVLEGKYKNCIIQWYGEDIKIHTGFFKRLPLNIETIKSYEIIKEDNSKSTSSVIGRGIVGGLLFGGVGALVGGYTAQSNGVVLDVEFKDGSSSIILLPQDFYVKLVYDFKKKNKKLINSDGETRGADAWGEEQVVSNTQNPSGQVILALRRFLSIGCAFFALQLLSHTFSENNKSVGLSLLMLIFFSFMSYILWGRKKTR